VQDAEIAALGPEDPEVPPSEVHRPGQPCLLCHGPYKGASPEMSVAGTIYGYAWDSNDPKPIPVQGVTIELFDTFKTSPPVVPTTNCAGNFYVTKDKWDPAFPLAAAIRYPVPNEPMGQRISMGTRISRDGSCGGCHVGQPNQGSPGWVYCTQNAPGAPTFTAPDKLKCQPGQGQ
jgi:hypothetical protein